MLGFLDMLSAFVSIKLVPDLNILLANYGLFYLYSICCVILGIAIYFVMPETTGLSLEEIEEIYRSKAKAKKHDVN